MSIPISRKVESYIRRTPSIAECLRRGLINHSALAKAICEELKEARVEAAKMAIGRFSRRTISSGSNEKKIERQLRKARLTIRGNMSLIILSAPQSLERLASLSKELDARDNEVTIVHGTRRVTLILGSEHRETARRIFGRSIHKVIPGLAKVQLLLDEDAMFTSGFSAFVLSQVASHGINVIEELTCAGEHLLLVKEEDLPGILGALRYEG